MASAHARLVTPASLIENWVDLEFLVDLITDGKNTHFNPMTLEATGDVELPPISEALLVKQLCFLDFAVAYYGIMDVTVTSQRPNFIFNFGAVSLRDIAVIDQTDGAFDRCVEEAQLASDLAMTVVFQNLTSVPDDVPAPELRASGKIISWATTGMPRMIS
jgi:hypothetical protein